MGFAILEIDDSAASGATFTKLRELQQGTILQVSMSLAKLGNFVSSCNCELFITEGSTNFDSAAFIFFQGAMVENAPFIWSGHYRIEGWENVVLRTFAGGGYRIKTLINIEFVKL